MEQVYGADTFYTYDGSNNVTFYNYTVEASYIVMNYKAYLYAPQNGTYTFQLGPECDDISWFWGGKLAYEGWNGGNENITQRQIQLQLQINIQHLLDTRAILSHPYLLVSGLWTRWI